MALLTKEQIFKIEKNKTNIHKPVQATYSIFEEQGKRIFQIDTYGSIDRQMPEKISQSIQIDEDMARFLIDELTKLFK